MLSFANAHWHNGQKTTYRQFTADPRMYASVSQEAFLLGEVEEGAVSDSRLFGALARIGSPSVEMSVEMDDGDGSVYFVECTEDGEDYGMVAAETDITQ